jgi:AcrR family transcriptional regulator
MMESEMPVKETKPRSKHQERTEATQAKLLRAAESIFARDGFAAAKLEQIAEKAGYTRGAIYAHYKSKEDLFLDLLEQRMHAKMAIVRSLLEGVLTPEERLQKFRAQMLTLTCDRSWALLVLEFKLYALRQPKLKTRMRRLMSMMHSTTGDDLFQLMFGKVKPNEKHAIERRFSLIGSIMSAAVLESHFKPALFTEKDLETVLAELLEFIVRR